nr:PREDICTED: beta-D-glucosyl crocetin beta-1,6-glucosyltransferase-like [Nicotiana tabacum]
MNNSLGPNVAFNGVEKSHDIILINTCNEIEGKYVDYLSTLSKKEVIPVGPLIREMKITMENEGNDSKIITWLDKKDESSCVYVSFGSEYFLSKEEIEEIAHSLELSELNFIWVLRFPLGEETNIENVLPKGFLDRVKEKGVIVEKWAPQARILEHTSVGGFLCHCGWNSILESLHFGVPLITMPMHLDQHTHSRMAVELGTTMEVVRDENGKLNREETAKVIRNVVMEKNGGESVKAKVRELRNKIREKGEEEFDQVVTRVRSQDRLQDFDPKLERTFHRRLRESRDTNNIQALVQFLVNMAEEHMAVQEVAMSSIANITSSFVKPRITGHFELKQSMIQLLHSNGQVTPNYVRLTLFPFSLLGKAKRWLKAEPTNSITSWNDLARKFLARFFPSGKTAKIRIEIVAFK